MPDVPFLWMPGAVLVGIAVGWAMSFESRRLAHDDMAAWRQNALAANRKAGALRREVTRYRHRRVFTGVTPPRRPAPVPNGWPDPEPHQLIRRGPDPTAATVTVVRGLPAAPAKRTVLPEIARLACPYFDRPDTGPVSYIVRRRRVDTEMVLPNLRGAA